MDEPSSQESISSHLSTNPRRKPAHESVCLKRTVHRSVSPQYPRLKKTTAASIDHDGSSETSSMDVGGASGASVVVEKPTCQQTSSGESTNPEAWFENSKNRVKADNEMITDTEPPFFLNHSSEETSPDILMAQNNQELPNRPPGLRLLSSEDQDGSSEGFRSIIDDLTVENRRLRRELKRQGRLRDSYTHPEALFEVRVHGLAAEKKHELEELLRKFVSKLDKKYERTPQSGTHISSGRMSSAQGLSSGRGGSGLGSSGMTGSGMGGVPSSLLQELTSSSTSRIGDSGYASISASGQRLPSTKDKSRKIQHDTEAEHRQNDIQSYLLDIPAGLLPHDMGPMSDREKEKIVVRRLEQLFAGRDSSGGHQQPIQQEKVAQSAARADRRAFGTPGIVFKEGNREARIVPKANMMVIKPIPKKMADTASDKTSEEGSDDSVVEQRPTRPLDLDPDRAQVPSENMKYIRHLGFSPPDDEDMSAQEDGHGWIYLNVLHNMAQLHLANVQMEFVRKAIAEHSQMLELSPDGRKLRWRGGHDVSQISNDGSPMVVSDNTTTSRPSEGNTSYRKSEESTQQSHRNKRFAYSPLFHRQASTNSGEESQYQFSNVPAASTIPPSSDFANNRADDAPIIFYQNTAFYTDLSGDYSGSRHAKIRGYHTTSKNPIGSKGEDSRIENHRIQAIEKGPLIGDVYGPPAFDHQSSTKSKSSGSLRIIPNSKDSNSSSNTPDHMDFEASGIGGVQPADNFLIDVRSRQNTETKQTIATPKAARHKGYSLEIRKALQKTNSTRAVASLSTKLGKSTIQREIIGSKTKQLPASRLPEGTYFHNSSDEEDEDEDMLDYESDDENEDDNFSDMPMPAPQRIDWQTVADGAISEDENDNDENVDDDDDVVSNESMDLLATARELHPEEIRLQEREFDSNLGDILAEEIPAGSSAATAEGGSGFNTPAYVTDNRMGSMAPPPLTSKKRKPTLKRARKSDGEVIEGRAPKSPKMSGYGKKD